MDRARAATARRGIDRGSAGEDEEAPAVIEETRAATLTLTRATAATAADRMLVPERVVDGLGHLLAMYLVARTAAG